MQVIEAQSCAECCPFVDTEVALHIGCCAKARDVVIVVVALRSRFDEKRGSFCGPVLRLLQGHVGPFDIDAEQRLTIAALVTCSRNGAGTDMPILLQGLSGQEVLQKPHVGMAQERSHVEVHFLQRSCPDRVQTLTGRFAECFGIRIAAIDCRILVRIFTQYEASRFLIKIACRKTRHEFTRGQLPAALQVQFALAVARVVAKATVVGIDHGRQPRRPWFERPGGTDAEEVVGAKLERRERQAVCPRHWHENIDDAV